MEQTHPPTVAAICDRIGRSEIAVAVGVGTTAVSNAAVENRFPARWFFVVRKLCSDRNIDCPEALFSFVGLFEKTSEGDAA